MNAPIIKFPRSFSKGIEGSRQSQEDGLQPYRERFDRFCCGARLGVNFDDVRGVSRAIVFGETGHRALFQLLDPLDFSL